MNSMMFGPLGFTSETPSDFQLDRTYRGLPGMPGATVRPHGRQSVASFRSGCKPELQVERLEQLGRVLPFSFPPLLWNL